MSFSTSTSFGISQHLRQVRTPRAAPVTQVARAALYAIGGDLVEPVDHLGVAAARLDETLQRVVPGAAAAAASNTEHIEPADQITEAATRAREWVEMFAKVR